MEDVLANFLLIFAYRIDPRAPKDAPFLREEMIYTTKWFYYFAIVEDFILRLSWVMNVSLVRVYPFS